MRCFLRGSAKVGRRAERARREGSGAIPGRGFALAGVTRAIGLAAIAGAFLAVLATPALAASSSQKVALIPGPGPQPPAGVSGQDGVMPTSQSVSGQPNESFNKFSFTPVGLNQITSAKLSQFDTVALIQVNTSSLSSAAKSALAQFVANGGKLLIHDSDETHLNDYTWILPGSSTTDVGQGCPGCGLTSGSARINANSSLISANPADPSYVDLAQLQKFTDAIGDANLLVSADPRWFAAAQGTNGKGDNGAVVAYASNNNGLVIYNGFDTDMIDPSPAPPWRCVGYASNYTCYNNGPHPSVDWLAQMWYSELNQSWGSAASGGNGALPGTTPVSSIGTPVPPGQAGLPTSGRCVAHRTLFLHLKQLVRRHRNVVQINVYVNGRHVLTERKSHWRDVALRRLPKKGSYIVKIVATTSRRYHLITKGKYRAC